MFALEYDTSSTYEEYIVNRQVCEPVGATFLEESSLPLLVVEISHGLIVQQILSRGTAPSNLTVPCPCSATIKKQQYLRCYTTVKL